VSFCNVLRLYERLLFMSSDDPAIERTKPLIIPQHSPSGPRMLHKTGSDGSSGAAPSHAMQTRVWRLAVPQRQKRLSAPISFFCPLGGIFATRSITT